MMKKSLVPLLALMLLSACGDEVDVVELPAESAAEVAVEAAPPAPAPANYTVSDAFNVGQGVYVRSLALEPSSNTLWVGSSVGVLEVDINHQVPRNIFTREHGLANEYVFGIFVDSRGNKWFGTNGGGVSRYKDGEWKTFFPLHGLADYWVYTFTEQADGTVWIGTWAGANAVNPADDVFTTYVAELVNEWVYGLDVDSQDRVWFGTEGGISMYDGEQWHAWTHADGLGAENVEQLPPSSNTGLGTRSRHDLSTLELGQSTYNPNYVFSVLVDPQDVLWAGTWGGGLSRFDGSHWQSYTTADGLAGNIVYSIAQAPDGALWLGTNGGLSRYDGQQWQSYTMADGLLGNNAYAVVVTAEGEVWVGTENGVARLAAQ